MTRRSINFNTKVERVWQWIFPTLSIAIAPVVAQYLLGLLHLGVISYSVEDFIAHISPHGELLIVAVALVAESASDIWRRQIAGWQKDVIGSLCFFFVLAVTLMFAGLTSTSINAVVISTFSSQLFIVGLALCIACKIAGRS